jgi:methionine synthase II (cobalamin-independent)
MILRYIRTTVRSFSVTPKLLVSEDRPDEYFNDLGTAYREEINELYALGCRKFPTVIFVYSSCSKLVAVPIGHIQFDDPTFAYFCSEAMILGMKRAHVDHEALLDTYIRAINLCVEDRPSDMTVGLHVCRGNFTVSFDRAPFHYLISTRLGRRVLQ